MKNGPKSYLSDGDCELRLTISTVENLIARHPTVGLANTTIKRQTIGFLPQTTLVPASSTQLHRVWKKNGRTTSILGITLTKFNKFL